MVIALLVAGVVGVRRLGYDEFAFIRRGTVLKVYELPVVKRGFFVVLVDLVAGGRRRLPGRRPEDGSAGAPR